MKLFEEVLESERDLEYITYGDTDSLFVNIKDLLLQRYVERTEIERETAAEILESIIEYDLSMLNARAQTVEPSLEDFQELIEKVDQELNKVIENTIDEIVKNFNVKGQASIYFEFEYLASRFFAVAGKTYISKPFGQNKIIQKNIGVKRSDPRLTKDLLKELFIKVLQKTPLKELLLFLFQWARKFKQKAQELSWEVGIPIVLNKPFSEYGASSKHVKSILNWNALAYYLEYKLKLENIPKFEVGTRGFKFDIQPKCFTKDILLTEAVRKYYNYISQKYKNDKLKFDKRELSHFAIPFEVYRNSYLMDYLREHFHIDLTELFRLAFCSYVDRFLPFNITPQIYMLVDKENIYDLSEEQLINLVKVH